MKHVLNRQIQFNGAGSLGPCPAVRGSPASLPAVGQPLLRAWSESEITAFNNRYNRLLRMGHAEAEAVQLAERLVLRDRDGGDLVACAAECRHYRAGRCGNHKAAGLGTAEVGRDFASNFASLMQRCAGFATSWPRRVG